MKQIYDYSWVGAFALLCLGGCGSGPVVAPSETPKVSFEPSYASVLETAERALQNGDLKTADALAQDVIDRSQDEEIRLKALFIRARVTSKGDAGKGSDAFTALLEQVAQSPLEEKIRWFSVRSALDAKRCLTAKKALQPILNRVEISADWVPLALEYSRCLDWPDSYKFIGQIAAKCSANSAIESELRRQATTLSIDQLVPLLAEETTSTTHPIIVDLLARRSDEVTDRTVLETLIRYVDEEHPYRPRIEKRLGQLKITILLPLSGRARHSGETLKIELERIRQGAEEDRADTGTQVDIMDGGTEESIQTAFENIAKDKTTFALIGLFDTRVSPFAAKKAQQHGIPMLMMTHKSQVTKKTQGIWRVFPTPLTVSRNLASAALKRGRTRAVVAFADQSFGKRYASWFKRVWEAAPNTHYLGDVKWPTDTRDYAAIAERIAQTKCDTLFLPIKPKAAAQLLRHLAAQGIWASGSKPRFSEEEEMREITIMAPPEWYDLQPGPILSHYGNHVLVPVSYAAENRDGQIFSQRIQEQTGRAPSTNLAVLLDSIRAIEVAHQKSIQSGISGTEAIMSTTYREGATSGFSFAKKEAVNRLFLMTLRDGAFTPAKVSE